MITLRLYLENISADWFGWIEDHPGAFAQGTTPQELERITPQAFHDYLLWLNSHGELLPAHLKGAASADFTIVLVESAESEPMHRGLRVIGCRRMLAPYVPPISSDTSVCCAMPGPTSAMSYTQYRRTSGIPRRSESSPSGRCCSTSCSVIRACLSGSESSLPCDSIPTRGLR